jgi:phosphatidate cytidylyltransferase
MLDGLLAVEAASEVRLEISGTTCPTESGVLTASLIGTSIWWATPFTPSQAFALSVAITLAGFAGGLVMSVIKRDRGVKDYGALIAGHGGMLDRIDSLCFAAPVFFHLTRYFFTP